MIVPSPLNKKAHLKLFQKFEDWWNSEYTRIFELDIDIDFYAESYAEKLSEGLGISTEEVLSTYVAPLKQLDKEQVEILQKLLTARIGHISLRSKHHHPFEFIIRPLQEHTYNAMLFQLALIHQYHFPNSKASLFKEDGMPDSMYHEPFQQCWMCGKPDVDKRGLPYRGKFCHTGKCTTSSGNYMDHDEDCCAHYWLKWKDFLRSALSHRKADKDIPPIYSDYCGRLLKTILERQRYTIRWDEDERVNKIGHEH
jgi:hypothetical protein